MDEQDGLLKYKFEMWRLGLLEWKLLPHQDSMYRAVHDFIDYGKDIQYVLNCTRRFGKTSVLIIIALEYCIRNKNTIVRFAMPFQKEARTIIRIFMKKLLEDCPDDVRPQLHTT